MVSCRGGLVIRVVSCGDGLVIRVVSCRGGLVIRDYKWAISSFGGFILKVCQYSQIYISHIIISRGAEGLGREILQRPPSVCLSVCPSVTFSFRTVTQKRIDVFSRNFAGTCTMSWGCAV